jgi:WXXGXW repeat (2 copies)
MNRNTIIRWVSIAVLLLSLSAGAFGGVIISVRVGPPALPVYAQPVCPGPGYIWTPGYWAWSDDDGYYWVPGTWVVAPVGMLWTPGYWGWNDGVYLWHAGYWGPHIGFYGGINYGFGYTGVGFVGGEWRGREFYYNRSVTNVTHITNVYNKTVIVNNTRVSYNGGEGGIHARPRPEDLRAEHEHHQDMVPAQREHMQAAARNPELRASVNHGRPSVAATARPADFHSGVPARAAGAAYHAPKISPREARGPSVPAGRSMASSSGAHGNSPRNNDGYRPFNPPSKNNGNNGRQEATSRPNNDRFNNNGRSSGPSRQQSAPRPQAHESAARQPAPAPQHHESAPAPQHHENASRAPEKHGR